jgi:hypothetical protein
MNQIEFEFKKKEAAFFLASLQIEVSKNLETYLFNFQNLLKSKNFKRLFFKDDIGDNLLIFKVSAYEDQFLETQ